MIAVKHTNQINPQLMAYQTPYEKTAAIDLQKLLVQKSDTTFYARVKGDGMMDLGIAGGDVLVIDISVAPVNGDIVVCATEDGFAIRKLLVKDTQLFLSSGEIKFGPVTPGTEMIVWGVVVNRIRKTQHRTQKAEMAQA